MHTAGEEIRLREEPVMGDYDLDKLRSKVSECKGRHRSDMEGLCYGAVD